MSFGSNKLGANTTSGSKTKEANSIIPCFALR